MACDNFLIFGTYDGKTCTPQKIAGTGSVTVEVVGETQDSDFKKALEIKEFSFGVENPTTIGSMSAGAGAGKAKSNEFTVKKAVDLASPQLFLAAGLGCHFDEVNLVIRKSGGIKTPYLIYKFALVFCTKVEWSGGAGEDAPDEDVTFVYGAMSVTYTQQKADGTLGDDTEVAWSQVLNQPSISVTS